MSKQNTNVKTRTKSVDDSSASTRKTTARKAQSITKRARQTRDISPEDRFKAIMKQVPDNFKLPSQFADYRLAKQMLNNNLFPVYDLLMKVLPDLIEVGCDLQSTYANLIDSLLKTRKYEAYVAMRYFATYDASMRATLRGRIGSLVERRVKELRNIPFSDLNFNCLADMFEWLRRAPSSTSNPDYFWNNFMYYMKGGTKNGVVLK